MRISGIVCECNPPHAGHLYLMDRARADGADAVILVMSGCFTQRGEAAILSPRVRAQMLLSGGADAVFELPFPHCAAHGEAFGAAGVSLLARLGITDLWFGSECGDLDLLRTAADITASPAFLSAYREKTRSGHGTAFAYADCLREVMPDAPTSPNDLLALSYLRALGQYGSITPHTVRRMGAGYHDESLPAGGFPSATALRGLLLREGVDALSPYFSPGGLALLRAECESGRAPADLSRLDPVLLACLRTTPPTALAKVAGLGGGIGERLAELARTRPDLDSVLRDAGVNCPHSRLRRGLLFALTGVTESDLLVEPAYAVLLAANRTGCRVLAERRRSGSIPIVTKRREVSDAPAALRQLAFAEVAFGLWSLCLPRPAPPSDFLRASAYVERGGCGGCGGCDGGNF